MYFKKAQLLDTNNWLYINSNNCLYAQTSKDNIKDIIKIKNILSKLSSNEIIKIYNIISNKEIKGKLKINIVGRNRVYSVIATTHHSRTNDLTMSKALQ